MKRTSINLIWGVILIGAGVLFLAQNFGVFHALLPQVWIVIFAGLSLLFFVSYFINGMRAWGWLFPACITSALVLTLGLTEAGIDDAVVGAPILVSIAIPFVVAFALDTRGKRWALIPAWIMAVLTLVTLAVGHISDETVGVFVMFSFALPFLVVFISDRRRRWALITCGVFCFAGVITLLTTQVNDELLGTLVMFLIVLPFLVVYLWRPKNWWALIPAGIMGTIGVVVLLAGTEYDPENTVLVTGVMFLGWALTFGMLWLRRAVYPTAWAKYPAIGLGMAALLASLSGADFEEFWPVIPIVIGVILLGANLRPQSGEQEKIRHI